LNGTLQANVLFCTIIILFFLSNSFFSAFSIGGYL
jgi:hypothetical protein